MTDNSCVKVSDYRSQYLYTVLSDTRLCLALAYSFYFSNLWNFYKSVEERNIE
jgi:hypothetical protein